MNEIDRPAALPPDLDAALTPMLAAGALPEGAALVYYPIVGSTNDLAATLAERGYPDSTIVVADEQISGPRARRPHLVFAAWRGSLHVGHRRRPAGRCASRLAAMADAGDRRGDLGRPACRVGAAGRDQVAERPRDCAVRNGPRSQKAWRHPRRGALGRRPVDARDRRIRRERATLGVSTGDQRPRHVARRRTGARGRPRPRPGGFAAPVSHVAPQAARGADGGRCRRAGASWPSADPAPPSNGRGTVTGCAASPLASMPRARCSSAPMGRPSASSAVRSCGCERGRILPHHRKLSHPQERRPPRSHRRPLLRARARLGRDRHPVEGGVRGDRPLLRSLLCEGSPTTACANRLLRSRRARRVR